MTDARIEAAARELRRLFSESELANDAMWLSCAKCILDAADAAAWIKISDKTPDDNQDVLVATYERIVTADTFNMDDEGGYFDITDDEEVTHWQPLPAPPYTPLEVGGNG